MKSKESSKFSFSFNRLRALNSEMVTNIEKKSVPPTERNGFQIKSPALKHLLGEEFIPISDYSEENEQKDKISFDDVVGITWSIFWNLCTYINLKEFQEVLLFQILNKRKGCS
jgi:hypothetical protein